MEPQIAIRFGWVLRPVFTIVSHKCVLASSECELPFRVSALHLLQWKKEIR